MWRHYPLCEVGCSCLMRVELLVESSPICRTKSPRLKRVKGKEEDQQCTALDSILKHQGAVYFHRCTSRHCRHAVGKSACMPVISCLDRLVFWTLLKCRHFGFCLPGFCHCIFFSRHFDCAVASEPDWGLVALGMDSVCGGCVLTLTFPDSLSPFQPLD